MSGDVATHSIFALAIRTMTVSRGRSPLAPGLPCGVTEAEQRLLQLLSEGKSLPEVGHAMGLHRDTIAMRAARVYRKLNVNNAAGAVAAALRKGIIK